MAVKTKHNGFTLIELSIVLVIIGLVVGGILVGKNLIYVSEIRATISDIDKLNIATSTFRNKYNCLPGDCAKASFFFPATSEPDQVSDGNGDGAVRNMLGSLGIVALIDFTYTDTERAAFMDHLASSSLFQHKTFDDNSYPVAGIHYPVLKKGGGIVTVYNEDFSSHAFVIGMRPNTTAQIWLEIGYDGVPPLLSAIDARIIDSKLDDGMPLSGEVYALDDDSTSSGENSAIFENLALNDPALCVSSATGNPYNSGETNKCAITIKAGF